ncbi:MAG TPA: type II secretion system protein [Candidatus Woesebacteria bacterium]|nr:type II secretion system protein [Candidatus Shapirobacteria bacterium]HOY61337.1 type II secretion system protein [Candidatus Woesebacteria bacterium]
MKAKNNKKLNKSPFVKGDVRPCLSAGGRIGGLAFTLFELLVSISIIGILIAVASLSYGTAQKKARDARRIEDLNAIQKAMEMYYSQYNYSYPSSQASLIGSSLVQSWPKDPKGTPYPTPVWGASNYCACTQLDNPGTGNAGNLNCTTTPPLNYYCVKNQQ